MKVSWTKGLTPEEEKDVRANFLEALVLRKRLRRVIEDKISEARRTSIAKSTYDNVNWAYLQADEVGYERALKEIIDLIE